MAVLLGAIKANKYDYLHSYQKDALESLKEKIKIYDKNWLRLANQNLRDAYYKHKDKATLAENSFNQLQRELIRKELNSRKK